MRSLLSYFHQADAYLLSGSINKTYALWRAVERNAPKQVRALIEAGADVHYSGEWFAKIAKARGYDETLRELVNGGADPEAHEKMLSNIGLQPTAIVNTQNKGDSASTGKWTLEDVIRAKRAGLVLDI